MLQSSKKGFTIIEVVIVLVIGAIIMLMVFLIVLQLQRSQRDARRQSDARKLLAASEQFATNNNGNYPAGEGQLDGLVGPNGYIRAAEFTDPQTGAAYTTTFNTGRPGVGIMFFSTNATCGGTNQSSAAGGNTRQVAVVSFQENGQSFCVNN